MFRSLLAILALLAALVGCGSDSDSAAGSASESTSADAGADAEAGVIAPEEAHDLVQNGAVLVDVRSADEFAAGHIEGARSIPLESGDFDATVKALDPSEAYVLYCETGNRAGVALERMTGLGFSDVVNAGGIDDLADVVGPVVTG